MSITKIAILGMGLIGGSLGMALRKFGGDSVSVTGFARRPQTADMALKMGAADRMASTPEEAVADVDFVFICTPMLQMLPVAIAVLPFMKPGSILTDVGSTKSWFAQSIRPLLPPFVHYIGGHPMAGREKSGIEAAAPELFRQCWFIFTPFSDTSPELLEKLRSLIETTGALTAVLDRATHDRMAAVISHVPHVAAAALVHLLKKEAQLAETARFIGGGFRDTTRIASSDADMWADICLTNPENIAAEMDAMGKVFSDIAQRIRIGDREGIYTFFSEAKQLRDALLLQEKLERQTPR